MKFGALVLAMAGVVSFSGFTPPQNSRDPKAQEILKAVSNKYKSAKSLSASFKVTVQDQKTKKNDTQSGTLIVKGNKYKLTLKGQEVISDGITVWTYLKESNEVQINNYEEKPGTISPTSIFTIYEKGFSSKYTGEEKSGTKTMELVELVPDDAKKTYFKIQLYVDKQQKMIQSARIFEKSGTHIVYSMDQMKINADTPDNVFTFDQAKYPGVEIVDLR